MLLRLFFWVVEIVSDMEFPHPHPVILSLLHFEINTYKNGIFPVRHAVRCLHMISNMY